LATNTFGLWKLSDQINDGKGRWDDESGDAKEENELNCLNFP
jgi:hypothetical protein